jgi:SAM-dependent methyltransferase
MNTYILPVGDADDERLNLEGKLLAKPTHKHLKTSIGSGTKIADIGCGNGKVIIEELLEVVDTIYAIDISPEQLEVTKRKVEAVIASNPNKKYATVHYIEADITKDLILPEQVDVIFMRFVLAHIHTSMYDIVADNLHKNIRVGGVVLSEEPITVSNDPEIKELINPLYSFINERFAAVGCDANLGSKLREFYKNKFIWVDGGWSIRFGCNLYDCKRICLLALEALKYKANEAELIKIKELDELIQTMEDYQDIIIGFHLGVITVMKV